MLLNRYNNMGHLIPSSDEIIAVVELSVSIAMGIASINLAILVVAPSLMASSRENFYRYVRRRRKIHPVIKLLSFAAPISLFSALLSLLGRFLKPCSILLWISPPLALVALIINLAAVIKLAFHMHRNNKELGDA